MKEKKKINFLQFRYPLNFLSLILICLSLYCWFNSGDKKYGIDFLGGTEIVVRFDQITKISDIRKELREGGIKGAVVQSFEEGTNDFSIRLKDSDAKEAAAKIKQLVGEVSGAKSSIIKQDFVGPVIGEKIRQDGLKALGFALACILVYISFRFEWRYALGAIFALVHDVIITSGIYVFSGREISAAVLAGLLTIIGYSLNDTIVVYDRVRENVSNKLKKGTKAAKESLKGEAFIDLVNTSINQTLSRTLLTSLTTFFVVAVLYFFGGGAISDLAFTLVIGVAVGTYSSIFIACPAILYLEKASSN